MWGPVDIFVRYRLGIDPYFCLLKSKPPVRWQSEFFLSNDVDTPHPVFMGNCPIPQPSWGYDLFWWDTHELQSLCDIVW
jgi:hypothetical protein